MQILRKFFFTSLLLSFAIRPIQAQPCPQYAEDCCEAYTECCYSAHWSAYVAVGLIVAACIWFGVADGNESKSKHPHSGSHGDGLGSIGTGSSRDGSSSYSSSSSHSYPHSHSRSYSSSRSPSRSSYSSHHSGHHCH